MHIASKKIVCHKSCHEIRQKTIDSSQRLFPDLEDRERKIPIKNKSVEMGQI
jgi:hypothetical protein